jgi:DNA-binding IclR family transcriptional regulator
MSMADVSADGFNMGKIDDSDDGLVQSVTRAFDVLFAVASASEPQLVGELSRSLGLPRPTVHRILNTLVASGVLARIDSTKTYVVTPKLALVTASNAETANLADMITPFLHRLVAISEETASLHVRVGDLRVCISEVEGSRGIRWARGPGWSAPIWSGAVGRILMADFSEQEYREVLDRSELRAIARKTVVDEVELHDLVESARVQGWCATESETVDGASATAAPIVGAGGRTIAALSLYAAADRLPHILLLVPELTKAASDASDTWASMAVFSQIHNDQESLQEAI